MLNRLEISNYALIENANISLNKGFTSITGETGAGKSILLKALLLLLGERADTTVLKQSEKKCVLEAEFDLSKLDLKSFFQKNDLDFEENCIIRREFNSAGKSRAFVNDSPVQMTLLKNLGEQLVSIHTQHQTLLLLNIEFQLDVLDHYAEIEKETEIFKAFYTNYRKKVNTLIELQVKDKENRKEKDYLAFLLKELEAAQLENIDLDELKQKAAKIENAEKIQTSIAFAKSILENESIAPGVGIKTLIETFDELKQIDKNFADISARLWSVKLELDDLESEIDSNSDFENFTNEEAILIQEKLELYNALSFKHNLTEVNQLIELQESLQVDLDAISTLENEIKKLSTEIKHDEAEVNKKAVAIRKKRLAVIPKLEKEIAKHLANLAMPNAAIKIDLAKKERVNANGIDQIEFLFKTNLGGNFSALKKAASGGELSRLMLTILSILSQKKNLPTLVFDEIDTGVSGEVAAKIAQEFNAMGEKIQIIAITHLPQVAGKAKTQLHVSKHIKENKTISFIKELDDTSRINVLASMISGEKITAAAKENAANLLSNS